MSLTKIEIESLINQAIEARKTSYCPYSQYAVGAALLTNDNHIIKGANIELSALSSSCCAERMALFNAIGQGHRTFKALAIVTEDGVTPCGACRQLMYELCRDIQLIIAKTDKTYTITSVVSLLPSPFNRTSNAACNKHQQAS